jgi:deazaflavin-dependent oxidoreductase (nitroreductase family)
VGSHPAALWIIKHVVSPLDRLVSRSSGGRVPPLSTLVVPTLLLTTVGRRSGRDRTVPLVYLREGSDFLVANARPAGERTNPWVLNLRAAATGRVRVGRVAWRVEAVELGESEIEQWWPAFVDVWPAFAEHFAATGERAVFRLELVP